VIRFALRGGRRVKIIKIQLRLARLNNGLTMDGDVIGAINIGLRYLKSDGRPMALASTELHEVQVKLLIPRRGLTPPTKRGREARISNGSPTIYAGI
jgi:transposase